MTALARENALRNSEDFEISWISSRLAKKKLLRYSTTTVRINNSNKRCTKFRQRCVFCFGGLRSPYPNFPSQPPKHSGGCCRMELKSALATDLSRTVEVTSDSQRRFAAWIGGSMFASLSTFDQVAITKQDESWESGHFFREMW